MGIFNNINKDTLNGLSLTKLNNDNIKISPGQISLGSTVMTLNESVDFIKAEFGCDVVVTPADKSKEAKANSAVPGKPAILLS